MSGGVWKESKVRPSMGLNSAGGGYLRRVGVEGRCVSGYTGRSVSGCESIGWITGYVRVVHGVWGVPSGVNALV